jgi:hypothetical protein
LEEVFHGRLLNFDGIDGMNGIGEGEITKALREVVPSEIEVATPTNPFSR